MILGSYRIEIPFEELKGYKRILIQLPSGLKIYARKIIDILEEKTEADILVSSDPCFGACDLAVDTALSMDADLLLHFGHLPIPNLKIDFPVKFVDVIMDIDASSVTDLIVSGVTEKNISIVTTAQHIRYLNEIRKNLEKRGYRVRIDEGDGRIAQPGLVLGCNFSSVSRDTEAVVFVGTGTFHPVGISISTRKPVYSLDPVSMTLTSPNEISTMADKLIRRRFYMIAVSQDAENFGILVSKKPGQNRRDVALSIRKKLEEKRKKSCIIVTDTIQPDMLRDFGKFDCFISTACPRIALDDHEMFDISVLTPVEFEILIGERKLDDYIFDSIT